MDGCARFSSLVRLLCSLDKLGIIPGAGGIRFVGRDDQGKLIGVSVAYTDTPATICSVSDLWQVLSERLERSLGLPFLHKPSALAVLGFGALERLAAPRAARYAR